MSEDLQHVPQEELQKTYHEVIPEAKNKEKESVSEHIEEEIRSYVLNSALTNLMESFGYIPTENDLSLEETIKAQKEFSNAHWDWRSGKERRDAKQAELTDEQREAAMKAADDLGMTEAIAPRKKRYDAIIILGAGGRHPLLRTQYAKECGAEAPLIVSLGSENEFAKKNPLTFSDYAPDAITEADLMAAAIEQVYGREHEESEIFRKGVFTQQELEAYNRDIAYFPEGTPEQEKKGAKPYTPLNEKWKVAHYQGAESDEMKLQQPDIFVLSAPSSNPERRANTSDTYAFLAHLLPEEAKDLLIVTSSNFAPFQHFDARRMLTLPFGKEVETVGFDTRKTIDTERKTISLHDPQQYLQEMNSAINSASALYQAMNATPQNGS